MLISRFEFDPFWGSIVIATSSLITIGILSYIHKHADNLSEKNVISLISLGAAASLIFSIADVGFWGYFVILMLHAGEHVLRPFMSEVLNKRVKDHHRATVLSVASFFRTLPYIVLAPIIGYLNINDNLEYFLVVWSALIIIAVALYVSFKKRDINVRLIKK